jgi:hypothetical protein
MSREINSETNPTLLHAQDYAPVNIEEINIFFQDFIDVKQNGNELGKKLIVKTTYKNGVVKSRLAGTIKKKKSTWIWTNFSSWGAEILKDKNFDTTLKSMNAQEKSLITELKKQWEIK